MNARPLLLLASAACGSLQDRDSEKNAALLMEVVSMTQNADGTFTVLCKSGTTEIDTMAQIQGSEICLGNPTPNSPFDIAWCYDAPVTSQQLLARFAPSATSTVLGSVTLDARQRQCQDQTGCAAWTAASSVPLYQITWNGSAYTFDDPTALAVPVTGTAVCSVPGPNCEANIGGLTAELLPNTAQPQLGWGPTPRLSGNVVQVGNWVANPPASFDTWGPVNTTNTCLFGLEGGRVYGEGGAYAEYQMVLYGQYAPAPGTQCIPTTCAAHGFNCGSIRDGCGGSLDCGQCGTSVSCGGGGTPNVCGFSDLAAHLAYCQASYGAKTYSCQSIGSCVSQTSPNPDWVCNADLCWVPTSQSCVDGVLH